MAFGLGFVLAAIWASHIVAVAYIPGTAPYRAAELFIRTSPEISAEVGRITDLKEISASAFRPWSSSDWKDVHYKIRVNGSSRSIVVWIALVKASGAWKPTDAAFNNEDGPKLKLQQ
jgi:hypothetical protein